MRIHPSILAHQCQLTFKSSILCELVDGATSPTGFFMSSVLSLLHTCLRLLCDLFWYAVYKRRKQTALGKIEHFNMLLSLGCNLQNQRTLDFRSVQIFNFNLNMLNIWFTHNWFSLNIPLVIFLSPPRYLASESTLNLFRSRGLHCIMTLKLWHIPAQMWQTWHVVLNLIPRMELIQLEVQFLLKWWKCSFWQAFFFAVLMRPVLSFEHSMEKLCV